MNNSLFLPRIAGITLATGALAACGGGGPELPAASYAATQSTPSEEYIIGPLDELTIHVWRNPELSAQNIQVRPDGRITIPLVRDMPAVGKTATQLQDDIRKELVQYIEQPIVSVIVNEFNSTFDQQIRVVGSTAQPASLPYRANMTVLDAMIAVGGLSEFASGNNSKLLRINRETGKQTEYRLRLADLLKRGRAVLHRGDGVTGVFDEPVERRPDHLVVVRH